MSSVFFAGRKSVSQGRVCSAALFDQSRLAPWGFLVSSHLPLHLDASGSISHSDDEETAYFSEKACGEQ